MVNATDFIDKLYSTLAELLNVDESSQSMFIQMAWPGYSLSPADFKPGGSPNSAYDKDIAKEVFSSLANMAPTFNKTKFENSGYEIDDLYEILIASAIPVGATPDTIGTNPMNRLFSDAQFELTQARRGSKSDPNLFYYPCGATPGNWYDEIAAQSWPTISIKSADIKPINKPTPIFREPNGHRDIWKLRPTRIDSTVLKSKLQQTVNLKADKEKQQLQLFQSKLGGLSKRAIAPTLKTKPLDANIAKATRSLSPSARKRSTTSATLLTPSATPEFSKTLAQARNTAVFKTKSTPINILSNSKFKANLQNITVSPQTLELKAAKDLSFSQKVLATELLNQQLETKPVSTTTNGYSLSFKFCRVNISRSWFKLALLSNKNWYMFNTATQEYSTGSADDNPGMFPLLPISFIAIRDLKITANWSQEDKKNLDRAVSFGPFDLRHRTINNNTLEVKGLQIIAWVSRLMPPLPPTQA